MITILMMTIMAEGTPKAEGYKTPKKPKVLKERVGDFEMNYQPEGDESNVPMTQEEEEALRSAIDDEVSSSEGEEDLGLSYDPYGEAESDMTEEDYQKLRKKQEEEIASDIDEYLEKHGEPIQKFRLPTAEPGQSWLWWEKAQSETTPDSGIKIRPQVTTPEEGEVTL